MLIKQENINSLITYENQQDLKMQASLVNLVKRKIIRSKKQASSIDPSYNLSN
jgi:hypothetical protein